MDKIETDLIANNIIDKTVESRINQLNRVAKYGEIKHNRVYENKLWEQMGMQTIKHCVNLHTYGNEKSNPSGIFSMFRELDQLNLKNHDLIEIRKETANKILKYSNSSTSVLWKIIQLDFLYRFSETEKMKNLNKLIEFDFKQQDTSNTVNLHIGANDKITLEGTEISKDDICEQIEKSLIEKKGIYFSNEKNTKYKLYLEAYNAIKDCVLTVRNEKSIENYGKSYETLNEKEKSIITDLIPLAMIETEPK